MNAQCTVISSVNLVSNFILIDIFPSKAGLLNKMVPHLELRTDQIYSILHISRILALLFFNLSYDMGGGPYVPAIFYLFFY